MKTGIEIYLILNRPDHDSKPQMVLNFAKDEADLSEMDKYDCAVWRIDVAETHCLFAAFSVREYTVYIEESYSYEKKQYAFCMHKAA